MPTLGKLAGYDVPTGRIIDGVDQTALLTGKSDKGARDNFYYFCGRNMHGVRKGKWKLLLADRKYCYGYVKDRGTKGIELYDLEADVGEKNNVAARNPRIVSELKALAKAFKLPEKKASGRKRKKWGRIGF
jgi:arylsulfatase A/uncharacterized sulfatase